jgi:hypothetical protein
MTYKVHRWDIVKEYRQGQLERFLNQLEGDIVAIIPNFHKTTLAQLYEMAGKVDYFQIIEKAK